MVSENPLQDAHTLQIHVSSHLKFSLNEQPGSDDDLSQLANVFALEFGQTLKSRLNAISVRYAKVQGRHAASSVTNVVLYCVFSRSSTAQSAKEFLSRLNPIAETWADEVWRVIRHGIISTENSVRLVGDGPDLNPVPPLAAAHPATPEPRPLVQAPATAWSKSLALLGAALAGALITWCALSLPSRPRVPVQSCAASPAPIPPTTQNVTVSCPTPPTATCRCGGGPSAPPTTPSSRVWSSDPGY